MQILSHFLIADISGFKLQLCVPQHIPIIDPSKGCVVLVSCKVLKINPHFSQRLLSMDH